MYLYIIEYKYLKMNESGYDEGYEVKEILYIPF